MAGEHGVTIHYYDDALTRAQDLGYDDVKSCLIGEMAKGRTTTQIGKHFGCIKGTIRGWQKKFDLPTAKKGDHARGKRWGKTFIGKPCVNCGEKIRYVVSGKCRNCAYRRVERYKQKRQEQAA